LNSNYYYGININPYEVIFIKQNRIIEPAVLNKYTQWHLRKIDNITKITYGISKTECIDITDKIYLHKCILETKMNINHCISKDPYPGKQKSLFIYINDNNIEKIKIINEHLSYLSTNVIML
jgi:hypothetical protein